MSQRFNVFMCKFDKFYICAVVGIVIEYKFDVQVTVHRDKFV